MIDISLAAVRLAQRVDVAFSSGVASVLAGSGDTNLAQVGERAAGSARALGAGDGEVGAEGAQQGPVEAGQAGGDDAHELLGDSPCCQRRLDCQQVQARRAKVLHDDGLEDRGDTDGETNGHQRGQQDLLGHGPVEFYDEGERHERQDKVCGDVEGGGDGAGGAAGAVGGACARRWDGFPRLGDWVAAEEEPEGVTDEEASL